MKGEVILTFDNLLPGGIGYGLGIHRVEHWWPCNSNYSDLESETTRTRAFRPILLMTWALEKGHHLGTGCCGVIRSLELEFLTIYVRTSYLKAICSLFPDVH